MKYIDVDKLIAKIEQLKQENETSDDKEYAQYELDVACGYDMACEEILSSIDSLQYEQIDMGEVSDGYHTFNELYHYRMLYNAAFFNLLPKNMVHKSKRHHTGEECFGGGWFIVMANLPTGQVSNHYELKDWDLFQVPEKEIADEWDGHTPQEAAERLHKYLQQEQLQGIDHICSRAGIPVPYMDRNQWCILKGDNIQVGIVGFGDTKEDALVDFIKNVLIQEEELDLKKFTEKMDAWKEKYNYPDNISIKATMAFTARMFYQYPNVARKWYEQLPKAVMD